MHGRIKVRTTEEQRLLKEKENQEKVKNYQLGLQTVLASRRKDGYSKTSLSISAQILMLNPDVYTLWNYRKEVVLMEIKKFEDLKATLNEIKPSGTLSDSHIENQLKDSNDEKNEAEISKTKIEDGENALIEFLENELKLTEHCLLQNPKSYGSWHHRYWILDHHSKPDWKKEFAHCTKYLKMDDRNLHCWDYRRRMVNKLGYSLADEIKFSTDRINANFSNYSSWHYRSTLRKLDKESVSSELSLVTNAVFTDPYDSSAWFYLRWVLSNPDIPSERIQELMNALEQLQELEPTCKWILLAKCWLTGSLRLNDKTCIDNRRQLYKELIELDPMRKGHYEECAKV